MKQVIDPPEWFNIMLLDAKLTAKDIMKLFGFNHLSAVHHDYFPKAMVALLWLLNTALRK